MIKHEPVKTIARYKTLGKKANGDMEAYCIMFIFAASGVI
jgi:hypothetical protein